MFGLDTLNVLIGLMTVYFMFGIVCTAIVEAVSACASIRSQNLESALKELFSGELAPNEQFITQFYEHPLIQSLSKDKNGRPSYIPSDIVAQVVEALVVGKSAAATLSAGVSALPGTAQNNRIKGILETLVMQTDNDVASFRDAVARQFDAVMDRASGWYKRRTQFITLVAATILVVGGNIDTINIATLLSTNPDVREKMVTLAKQNVTDAQQQVTDASHKIMGDNLQQAEKKVEKATTQYEQAVVDLQSVGLPLGWKSWPHNLTEVLEKMLGLLVTIFAVSLGGPFWFDILQRVMEVRATGPKPPEKISSDSK